MVLLFRSSDMLRNETMVHVKGSSFGLQFLLSDNLSAAGALQQRERQLRIRYKHPALKTRE